jgi:hypothetical protein
MFLGLHIAFLVVDCLLQTTHGMQELRDLVCQVLGLVAPVDGIINRRCEVVSLPLAHCHFDLRFQCEGSQLVSQVCVVIIELSQLVF